MLTSNTFALNESAQASLKSKFKGQQQQQHLPQQHQLGLQQAAQPPPYSGPLVTSSPKLKPAHNNNTSRAKPPPSPLVTPAKAAAKQEAPLLNDLRGKVGVEQLIGQLTRSHTGPGGKESHQVASKKYFIFISVKNIIPGVAKQLANFGSI